LYADDVHGRLSVTSTDRNGGNAMNIRLLDTVTDDAAWTAPLRVR